MREKKGTDAPLGASALEKGVKLRHEGLRLVHETVDGDRIRERACTSHHGLDLLDEREGLRV
jgi:hypothetical protein